MEVGGKEEKLPPGFRFHPTDEELITFYLTRKLADSSFTSTAIGNIDLNKCEPWDLPGNAKMGEKEWYFFNLRDRKYPTGLRTNRATDAGYWKTTGKDKEIYASANSELAGMKKTLVFYKGRAPRGEKTNWVMHEYRIQPDTTFKNGKDEWVVCRVFKKNSVGKKLPPNPMRAIPSNLEARSAALSSLLQQDPYDFNLGLSHLANVELMDLSKVSMGSLNTNLFGQPRLALPAAFGQQLPGSNLDLPARRNVLLAMPLNGHDLPLNRELPASTMSSGIMLNPNEMCTGAEFPSGGEACHLVDACRRLGGYWPASY